MEKVTTLGIDLAKRSGPEDLNCAERKCAGHKVHPHVKSDKQPIKRSPQPATRSETNFVVTPSVARAARVNPLAVDLTELQARLAYGTRR
jgi:hypothetical protein